MNLINQNVKHNKYGIGKIIEQCTTRITIEFPSRTAKFDYPSAFEKCLIIEDEKLHVSLIKEIKNHATVTEDKIVSERINKLDLTKTVRSNVNKDEPYFRNINIQKVRKDNESRIKHQIDQRGVKYLIHFTRIENLHSILQKGLVPISDLNRLKIDFVHNDDMRLDGQLDCTSCSVDFPNDRLFYVFREQKFWGTKWVVLKINKDILFSPTNIAFFCYTNAAHVLPKTANKAELCTSLAFEKMYSDEIITKDNKIINRSLQRLNSSMTTDPQAEILISGTIETKYIATINFYKEGDIEYYRSIYGSDLLDMNDYVVEPDLFRNRNDLLY